MSGRCGVLGLLLLVLACRPEKEARSERPPAALRDPLVVAVDGLAPTNRLEGGGSLSLGEGWGKPEGSGAPGDWGSMAWALGREASIHLVLPPVAELDFYSRTLPYPWEPGSPIQTLELVAGDRVIGRRQLVQGWADLRIPLPDDLPRGKMLDLRLRFDHSLKPENDSRSLAAAFSQLAVMPRGAQDPQAFLDAHAFDPATGRVALPVHGGLRLPLAPASRVEVRLRDVAPACTSCALSLELGAPGEAPREIPVQQGSGGALTARFETAALGVHSLWIRAAGSLPDARGTIGFTLDSVQTTMRPAAGAAPPPVFVYMIDTLRADELAPYGGPPSLTPRMNAFAEQAATYLQARAPSSWTLPSVVSMLTGVYPDRHGVMTGAEERDPERHPSLQRLLGRRGYRTVGISHSAIISSLYGADVGFGSFYLYDNLNGRLLRSQEARGFLAGWLSQDAGDAPVFAYLHTVDPHAPYAPPAGPGEVAPEPELPSALEARGDAVTAAEVSRLRESYQGEVRAADRELGHFLDLLQWLGLYDQSFVILVGDHGEEFAEHGGFEHGTTLYEEVLRVPLLVKYPGGRWAGARIEEPVSLVDVPPTVLAALDNPPQHDFDGNVLPGPGESRRRDQVVYFEVAPYRSPSAVPVNLRGLVADGVKCIENRAGVDRQGRPAPPLEAFALARAYAVAEVPLPQAAPETARCRELLDGWSRSRTAKILPVRNPKIRPEALERLRALGYAR